MKLTGNNLIIVNILATYGRILFVAGLGLFSTRWVLQALGKEDFGLYSVVGGLIVFILFIGNTMAGSVQRFYAYAIGQGDSEEVKRWFNCAFVLHAGFSVILVLIGIPLGNYLLDNVMQIPDTRLTTCHWVYYLSILGGVGTMLTTPYLAMFYAKQRIFELTIWGTLQAVLMFALAWYLATTPEGDLLFYYAFGMVAIKLILDFIQMLRALYLFKACHLKTRYLFLKANVTKLFSFVGWSLIGAVGNLSKNQGLSFLVNVFSGAKVNAALGIANQIASQTGNITNALTQAISPEIMSREGAGDRERMISLSLRTSKFATLLTFLWLIPFYIELDYILALWLTNVPEYTLNFSRIVLISYTIDKTTIGYISAIQAQGNIAGYNTTIGVVFLITFPLALGVYLLGGAPDYAVSTLIFTSILGVYVRLLWFKHLMGVSIVRWIDEVLMRSIYSLMPTIVVAYVLNLFLSSSFYRLMILFIVTGIVTMGSSCFLGLNKDERYFMLQKLKKYF